MATEATLIICVIAQLMCFHVQSDVFKQCFHEVNVHYGLTRPDKTECLALPLVFLHIMCENNINTCIYLFSRLFDFPHLAAPI